jgi:PKD repeat protein
MRRLLRGLRRTVDAVGLRSRRRHGRHVVLASVAVVLVVAGAGGVAAGAHPQSTDGAALAVGGESGINAAVMWTGPRSSEAPGPPASPEPPGPPESNATRAQTESRDTTVLWRGFRHVWSYNHRFNRFGSWVDVQACGEDLCDYVVGHSGASGSGTDKAAVRDAYTELSAENVDFYTDTVKLSVEGTEKDPKNGGSDDVIAVEQTVKLDPGRQIDDHERYAVVLNGFDMEKENGASAKVVDFRVWTTRVRREEGDLVFTVEADVLLDCDSVECNGAGGKAVQDVDYDLSVDYLVIGGDASAFAATRTDPIDNTYSWEPCYNNKVENPFSDVEEDDDWAGNTFPGNRMNCERSTERELHADDFERQRSIRSAGEYGVGTVGIKSLSVNLDSESHFTQYDTVVGGEYRGSGYGVHALPFFKEWSTRPGQYGDARFSYGFRGEASVSVTPVLLEFRRACKRSFVNGGGLRWPGGGKDPGAPAATVREEYRFRFGNHWQGESGGSLCDNEVDPLSTPTSPTAKPAFWVPADGGSQWNEFDGGSGDRTRLLGEPGDRYYSGEQENVPRDTAGLERTVDFGLTDDDGDGKFSELLYQLDADLRYDDPVDPGERGDPFLRIEYKRVSGDWRTISELTPVGRDNTILLGQKYDSYADAPPDGVYTHVRITLREGGATGPRLDRIVVPLPEPVEFETVANDRVVRAVIDSEPSGATLYIDGEKIGTTPVRGEIPAGEEGRRLRVVLKKEGYQPSRARLRLQEGDANSYTFDLRRPDEPIVVRSEPKASVWFDGVRVGTTPYERGVPADETVDVELRPVESGYLPRTYTNVSPPATIDATLAIEAAANYTPVYDFPEIVSNDSTPAFDPGYVPIVPDLTATVANASVPDDVTVGRQAVFDASGSYSLVGSIDSYEWRFGDGTTATGAVVNHTYDSTGTYRVTLEVTANGTTANTTRTVTVSDRPPQAALSVVDSPVEVGQPATFDASGSVDPERDISEIRWQTGDGVRRTGQRIAHTYTAPGNYTVTVRVIDGNGNDDTATRTIRVRERNDPPEPSLSVGTRTATVGESVSFDASGSTDPDGSIRRYVWRLDSGATVVGETFTFAFSRPGRHDVTLVVVDDDGDRTTTTATVVVVRETDTRTPTQTPTGTSTPTTTDVTPTSTAETTTDDSGSTAADDGPLPSPGFGPVTSALALLLALVGLAAFARRRR